MRTELKAVSLKYIHKNASPITQKEMGLVPFYGKEKFFEVTAA